MNRNTIRSEFSANEFLSTQPALEAWRQPSVCIRPRRKVSILARILSALF